MNMKKIIALCLLNLLVLTGCKKKPLPLALSSPDTKVRTYSVKATGVECILCAKSAMKAVASVPQVHEIKFNSPDGVYEHGLISFSLKSGQQLPIKEIHQELKERGFSLEFLTGSFEGTIVPGNESRVLCLHLHGWTYPFVISGTPEQIQHLFDRHIINRAPVKDIAGTLVFDHHHKKFGFKPQAT